jgi:hypothetical protein
MVRSAGYTGKIIGGDTIVKRIYSRVGVSEKDLIHLLDCTWVTIAISFDGWTSTNNIVAGPDMKI